MVDYGAESAAMRDYFAEGEVRALALDNRGPIRLAADGGLEPAILEAYGRHGFYVFEGVVGADELADIEADVAAIQDRLPVASDAALDAKGRPALGVGHAAPTLFWSKPLGDPFGGTDLAGGRHPVKMAEPAPAPVAGAPGEIVYLIQGSLQYSEAILRLYGHPGLLAVAAAVNGADFTAMSRPMLKRAR